MHRFYLQSHEDIPIQRKKHFPNSHSQDLHFLEFYIQKRKENVSTVFILVMIMLHYLPRFQKEPETTDWVEKITGNKPKTFDEFVAENIQTLQ